MAIIDEIQVSVAEVVNYTKIKGSFAQELKEVVSRKIAVDEAKKRGISIGDEELQEAVDIFRRVNNLLTSNGTDLWLKERGLTIEALEEYVESNLMIYQLKNQIEKEYDTNKFLETQSVQESIREAAYQEWLVNAVG